MESLESGPVLLSVGFIGFFSITLFVRRWLASRRSGGPFFAPFHINRGIFYIHVPLCFSRRSIPLKEIKQITYFPLRGRSGGGSRYAFYIELRTGKTIPFFFGKSKRNEELVAKLKRNAGRYGFKVHDPR
ncbi:MULTISPECIES: hypothetical protein [Streptococcus]|uniref:Uncharacterized protein n=1 Tax=Streptococcus viridans TaxID=78535 RepID=A0A447Z4W2_9STRE|nr:MULTISPECIES: hypothetical protein [Streptococcus]VED67363.1 Uncharacterised protein [Streptococcus viridans]VEE19656.1 Uncharacterised protein [Streptococcus australis]